ncbi:MAG: prepilin-type N-terminal cleavage/methylation domain-containing protein [Candidatus Hydrogenedentes bacterium]|nr:prepilin-type N-terminal cleavage/methylation domain-containing protein [Candidatus Hydrogenedentota bacterium]
MFPRKCFNRRRVRGGFTLLELITVIIVLGILSGVMVPMFRDSFTNLQVRDATKNFIATIRFAQAQAIVQGVEYRVCLGENNRRYWVIRQTDPADDIDKFEMVKSEALRTTTFPDSLQVRTVSAPKGEFADENIKYIPCYPNGRIGQARIVIVGSDKETYTIRTTTRMAGVQLVEGTV